MAIDLSAHNLYGARDRREVTNIDLAPLFLLRRRIKSVTPSSINMQGGGYEAFLYQ